MLYDTLGTKTDENICLCGTYILFGRKNNKGNKLMSDMVQQILLKSRAGQGRSACEEEGETTE